MEKTPPPPNYYQATEKDSLHQPLNTAYPPQNTNYYPIQPNYQSQPVIYTDYTQNVGYQAPYYNPNQVAGIINQQSGVIPSSVYSAPPPNSYSVLAWLTCLFCCWPLGLCAVIKSMEVSSSIAQGNLNNARIASEYAKKYGVMSLAMGIFIHGAWILFIIVYFAVILPKSRNWNPFGSRN